jgi:hypothetical protein
MKILVPIVSGCIAFAPCVSGQVSVDLALEQDQFLPGESLMVGVRITNFSGQTLHLGKESDWLHIGVEGRDNYVVPATADLPIEGEFDVESSKVVTRRVDVAPCFALVKPGRYTISATVKLKDWDKELVSKQKSFDIIAGTTLWEQDVGVSAPAASNGPPEVRKYALQQAIHLKQMKLYVRVTDQAGGRVFRVFPIGPLISFSSPEHQIDKSSNLHVLYQTGAKSFNYSVINPDGKWVIHQTYEYSDTRPVLRMGKEGRIYVGGGNRRISSDDLPVPVDTSNNDASSAKP